MDNAIDLSLLQLFEVLYRERHLTRAALLAGKSQPAMSRALAQLREMFGDELFVRTARGMIPTPRADRLAPEIAAVLAHAHALVTPVAFDPSRLERTFVIATSDLVEQELVSGAFRETSQTSPRVNIMVRPIADDIGDLLASGRVDLVIAPRSNIPLGLVSQFIFADDFICAVRVGHPRVKRTLTLKLFAELAHVQITPRSLPGGPVDDALAARGLSRRVAVRTPSFLTAPMLAASSDLVLTGPSHLLGPLAVPFGLRLFPLPIAVPGFRIHHAWHPRAQDDEAHKYFRSVIANVAKGRNALPAPQLTTPRRRGAR